MTSSPEELYEEVCCGVFYDLCCDCRWYTNGRWYNEDYSGLVYP